jgi:transcription elongation factor Elf1
MLEASKEERAEIYRDSRFHLFLNKFLSGELEKLNPVYDPKHGYRYPLVEAIIGDSAATEEFLNRLYEVGFLKRELYDKIIYCPACSSANVSTRYRCPYCRTFDIKKSSLIEHVSCGYIDTEERFRKKGKLVCPKCGVKLTKPDVDYRKAGVWCSCNECGKSFDIPVPSHFCRECSEDFTFEDANYRNIYSYSLNETVMKEAGAHYMLVAPVREFLQNRGFHVESPGFLKGKSGASHIFDIIASSEEKAKKLVVTVKRTPSGKEEVSTSSDEKTKEIIVIDIASSQTEGVVSEQSIISMFAKVFDVAPNKACLIAIPKMSENGRKLADLYKIKLIEAEDQDVAVKALESVLGQTSTE